MIKEQKKKELLYEDFKEDLHLLIPEMLEAAYSNEIIFEHGVSEKSKDLFFSLNLPNCQIVVSAIKNDVLNYTKNCVNLLMSENDGLITVDKNTGNFSIDKLRLNNLILLNLSSFDSTIISDIIKTIEKEKSYSFTFKDGSFSFSERFVSQFYDNKVLIEYFFDYLDNFFLRKGNSVKEKDSYSMSAAFATLTPKAISFFLGSLELKKVMGLILKILNFEKSQKSQNFYTWYRFYELFEKNSILSEYKGDFILEQMEGLTLSWGTIFDKSDSSYQFGNAVPYDEFYEVSDLLFTPLDYESKFRYELLELMKKGKLFVRKDCKISLISDVMHYKSKFSNFLQFLELLPDDIEFLFILKDEFESGFATSSEEKDLRRLERCKILKSLDSSKLFKNLDDAIQLLEIKNRARSIKLEI